MNYFRIKDKRFELTALNQAYIEIRDCDNDYVSSINQRTPLTKILETIKGAWTLGYSAHYISFRLGDVGVVSEICKNNKVIYMPKN